MLCRRTRLNNADINANRLFSLFAQNRRHRIMQCVDHPDADVNDGQSSLKLDWNAFCSDLYSDPAHVSTWQRLSQQIIRHHRSNNVLPSKPLFDSKFKRSFNVANAFTARALMIKGVSPAIIAKTQTALCKQQLQHSKPDFKGRQIDLSVTESRDHQLDKPPAVPAFLLSSKHRGLRRDTVAPLRSRSLPTVTNAHGLV